MKLPDEAVGLIWRNFYGLKNGAAPVVLNLCCKVVEEREQALSCGNGGGNWLEEATSELYIPYNQYKEYTKNEG